MIKDLFNREIREREALAATRRELERTETGRAFLRHARRQAIRATPGQMVYSADRLYRRTVLNLWVDRG